MGVVMWVVCIQNAAWLRVMRLRRLCCLCAGRANADTTRFTPKVTQVRLNTCFCDRFRGR